MTEKEKIAKAPERRVTRAKLGTRNVLTVDGKDPDFSYRVVNDTGDRVQQLLDLGYIIEDAKSVQIGDRRLGSPTTPGTKAEVSVGGGQKAFVMKQRKVWYDEDQAVKQAYVNDTEAATREEALNGTYGDLKITRS